jgi:uncharacterized protein YjdB
MATEYQKRAQSATQKSTLAASATDSIGNREIAFDARARGDGTTIVGGDNTVTTTTISATTMALLKGTPQTLTAIVTDAGGLVLANAVTWLSSDATVATVGSTTGIVTAVKVGTCNVKATAGAVDSADCAVTITAILTTLVLADSTLSFAHTTTGTTTVTATDQYGASMTVPADTAANSSDETKATVGILTGTITVTGVAAGTTNVTATEGGITSNVCAVTLS